jgi:hypothetical protein
MFGTHAGNIRRKPVMEWEITTTSSPQDFTIPLNTGTINFTVNWGDGSARSNAITSTTDTDRVHSYANAGTYKIKFFGQISGIYFNNTGSKLLLDKILYWGRKSHSFSIMQKSFWGCANLEKIPSQISDRLKSSMTNISAIFAACDAITTIPSGMFDNMTSITNFEAIFEYCSGITAIPANLFDKNTLVQSFYYSFAYCDNLTTIPPGIFNNLTNITTVAAIFGGCSKLETIPTGLFKYNTKISTFLAAFQGDLKLTMDPWIFYNDGEQSTRFLNKSVIFSYFFDLSGFTFSGTQGTAPDVWNCNFGTGTATKLNAFKGTSTAVDNYASIPNEWKGL